MGDNEYVLIFNSTLMELCQKDDGLSPTGITLINQLTDLLGEALRNYFLCLQFFFFFLVTTMFCLFYFTPVYRIYSDCLFK